MYREVSFYVKPDLHFEVYRKLRCELTDQILIGVTEDIPFSVDQVSPAC